MTWMEINLSWTSMCQESGLTRLHSDLQEIQVEDLEVQDTVDGVIVVEVHLKDLGECQTSQHLWVP